MTFAIGRNNDGDKPNNLVEWILDRAIDGIGPLCSAQELADEYRQQFSNTEEAINTLIAWETSKAGASGFMTGLGGLATMPIAIPASVGASYVLGARLAAVIADLRGWDIKSDQVRSFAALCLIGGSASDVMKGSGIAIGVKITEKVIYKNVSRKTLVEINRKVGFRLVTKAGGRGFINLTKMVPLVGGFIGAGFDGTFVFSCGQAAKGLFPVCEFSC